MTTSNKPKKQHYIPQFYLRNFSSNKYKVRIFQIKNQEIKLSPISTTCQERFFYGKDGEFEEFLKGMDDSHSNVINRIVQSKSLLSNSFEDYYFLLQFLLTLHERTRLELEIVESYVEAF
jgi:hypothetical protein